MCFDFVPLQITIFGKSGKSVGAMSDKPKETEVLFPPKTKFKVTAVDRWNIGTKNEQFSIIVEEV